MTPGPYRVLFEKSADAQLIIDEGVFVDCNQSAMRMLGFSTREALINTHPSEISPPLQPDGRPSFEKANEMVARAFAEGSQRFEWLHRRADGDVFPVEVLLTPVPSGGSQMLHVVWRNISERKRLEERLRHSLKMEAIGKLAGGVAHDFNNLLVAILGYADLLRMTLTDPEQIKCVDEIEQAGERAATLTRQLLAFGRKQVLDLKVVDLNELLSRVGALISRLIGERVELSTLPAANPALVSVDASQIELALINLAVNARDALPEGGALVVSVRHVAIAAGASLPDEVPPGRYVRMDVRDDGVGMSPETLATAFDPFFTTKDIGQGTGLGLASVHGIVKQAGGYIWIESQRGVGTCVTILLPDGGARKISPPHVTSSHRHGGSETILVVEDERAVRELMERRLEDAGYQVLSASSGERALELMAEAHVDLLVTDVLMPKMNGPELVARIKAAGAAPGVIFVSGHTNDTLSRSGVLEEGVELLRKPFSVGQLLTRIRLVLDGAQRG